jgi:hypothetical protein
MGTNSILATQFLQLHTTVEFWMGQRTKVVVPSLETSSWDACSMTLLETHFLMHLK